MGMTSLTLTVYAPSHGSCFSLFSPESSNCRFSSSWLYCNRNCLTSSQCGFKRNCVRISGSSSTLKDFCDGDATHKSYTDIWVDSECVEVIGIGNRVEPVLDFCLRSPSHAQSLRFWADSRSSEVYLGFTAPWVSRSLRHFCSSADSESFPAGSLVFSKSTHILLVSYLVEAIAVVASFLCCRLWSFPYLLFSYWFLPFLRLLLRDILKISKNGRGMGAWSRPSPQETLANGVVPPPVPPPLPPRSCPKCGFTDEPECFLRSVPRVVATTPSRNVNEALEEPSLS
ncbi:hypothetical protein Cgig2_012383 [Carnegiea gigantea]|uniref:Uncharacterized protein n=1 Tax=Carnegiea gigantea TaxID=171969 RepID=A0A9Q1JNN0_9CARY|nr:hypothetical protein Cgig2_012383 [Carnegiea gigantea]